MNKSVFLILFNLTVAFYCGAQGKSVADSLNHTLRTSKNDKARIGAYIDLAGMYYADRKMALSYADSAWHLASTTQVDHAGMQCDVACLYAGLYRTYGDSVNYQKQIQAAAAFADKAGDKKYTGLVYHQRALHAYFVGDGKLSLEYFLKSIDLLENTEYQDVCVGQYYFVTAIFERLADYDACLVYAKKARRHSSTINDICRTNHNIANTYFHLAESNPAQREAYIDSSLTLLYQARDMLEANRDQIRHPVLPLKVYNDLANVYMRIDAKMDDDSARYYLNLARNEAIAINNNVGYASMSVLLASYDIKDNHVARAATLMDEAQKAYEASPLKDLPVEANISMGFALLNEKRGFFKEALQNHRRFFELKDSMYHIESLEAVKRAESKFLQEKKERQIELLKEKEAGRRQKLYFAMGAALAALVALLMLYRSTRFKKKFYTEKERLLAQQAETARLQKEETEYALHLQKKASERLALEHQFEASQRNQYQRELTTGVQYLESKNELLLNLKEAIGGIPPGSEEHKQAVVARMLKLIGDNLEANNDFDRFSRNFEYVYPNFFKKLEAHADDNLSQLDLRYCAYIHMGLSTKEMSNLLNIDPASIRTARYRLKQKFDLGKEEDLMAFINNTLTA